MKVKALGTKLRVTRLEQDKVGDENNGRQGGVDPTSDYQVTLGA